ncbi:MULTISPECIES: aldo/keto reductase [Staphylococcus]|jgi:diketogulonate reductase-like aldo/keto reductase|uniref:Aldo/keto reductase n=5 Tax=Staphylococcus TaxID=1279 RepID=A0A1L8Y6F5_STAHO|nr:MULTISPECIES: aldo/keto reductase [Staphylococcus]EUZ67670.1 aldo/keto reductase family oxidoreductase [Staphylococcus sp. M0480]OFK84069.1 glyoxal reductase [Staphylococcus sp. HMSC057A02]OFM56433.1 glyoxal reductase [Staphylococcus sp. HMSC059G05]OFM65044.1 glyoxal reductase [Staphylococcus sp. HMSC062C01]OFM65325.1 glyoxal reductase [Staphylococcus sp. HMSC068D07]OFM77669.1 glyoxal reductase [Staphylococcus sp. HMSC074B09]OFM93096.1 glyoxal reductase [Staphylococcus sp. HMSC078D05]OFN
MDYIEFYNGNQMPMLGLGTFRVENDDTCKEAVKHAIESGYRSIDTAKVYGNEEQVGQGIKEGLESTGLNREDIFVTSKLFFEDFGRKNVAQAYETSIQKLGLDYLDLYLVHWPGTNEAIMIDTWKGMEDLYKDNKVKNIGVSNFNPDHFEALLAQVSIKPVINQVEFHPYFTQEKLRKYLEAQNIYMESWSPFMNAQILNDETLNEIGKEVNKSAAQVIIKWNMQHNVVVIPKSVTSSRIEENIDVFDFELSAEQMKRIDDLNKDQRIGPDPDTFEGQ